MQTRKAEAAPMENPYAPPEAKVELPERSIPEDVQRKIRHAWIAALVSAGITAIAVGLAVGGVLAIPGIDAWGLIDVGVTVGLAYGVYRKSRTCAIALLVLFVLNTALKWAESGTVQGLPIALVFLLLYVQGVIGTFQYQKLARQPA